MVRPCGIPAPTSQDRDAADVTGTAFATLDLRDRDHVARTQTLEEQQRD
jgi:hypothetical protein